MKERVNCNCGRVFNSVEDWYIHYSIGMPNRLALHQMYPWLTQETVDERDKEIIAYKEEHSPEVV